MELAQLNYLLPRLQRRGPRPDPAGRRASARGAPAKRSSRRTAGGSPTGSRGSSKDIAGLEEAAFEPAGEPAERAPFPRSLWSATRAPGNRPCSTCWPKERRYTSPNLFSTLDPLLRRVSYPGRPSLLPDRHGRLHQEASRRARHLLPGDARGGPARPMHLPHHRCRFALLRAPARRRGVHPGRSRLAGIPVVKVLNKIDLLADAGTGASSCRRNGDPQRRTVAVSAKTGAGRRRPPGQAPRASSSAIQAYYLRVPKDRPEITDSLPRRALVLKRRENERFLEFKVMAEPAGIVNFLPYLEQGVSLVKRTAVVGLALLGAWSCVTCPPAPPAFHIEDLPSDASTRLTSRPRIAADEAWTDLKAGRPDRAQKYLIKLGKDNPVREAGLGLRESLSAGDLPGGGGELQRVPRSPLPGHDPGARRPGPDLRVPAGSDKAFARVPRDPQDRPGQPLGQAALRGPPGPGRRTPTRRQRAGRRGNRERPNGNPSEGPCLRARSRRRRTTSLARIFRQEKNTAGSHPPFLRLPRNGGDLARAEGRPPGPRRIPGQNQRVRPQPGLLRKAGRARPTGQGLRPAHRGAQDEAGGLRAPQPVRAHPFAGGHHPRGPGRPVAVKFKDFLNVPERQTEILVDIATSWAQKFIIKVASLAS